MHIDVLVVLSFIVCMRACMWVNWFLGKETNGKSLKKKLTVTTRTRTRDPRL